MSGQDKDQGKKKAIIAKIEDLNAVQSSLRHRIQDLEKKKNELPDKKYHRYKEKFSKKIDKIRGKIHDLELELKEY